MHENVIHAVEDLSVYADASILYWYIYYIFSFHVLDSINLLCITYEYLFYIFYYQTIPRDVTVSFAVYETEEELLKGAFKLYPKLKAFWEARKDKEGMFEYGQCLKAFPDEPILVLVKPVVEEQKGFFQNW